MSRGRKLAIFGAGTLLTLLITAFVCTREAFLKKRLIGFASGHHLVVELEHVRFTGRSLLINGLLATYGATGDQRQFRVTANELILRPAWWRLLYGRFRVARLEVVAPQITMIDDAGGKKSEAPEGAFDRPTVDVDDFEVSKGMFTFVRVQDGTRAVIALRDIRGRVAAFGTTKGRRDDPVTGEFDAQLGFSGESHLSFTARPTAKTLTADVTLVMKDQDLKDLGDFFEPNVGLKIAGRMKIGRSESKMRGDQLTTHLNAVFEGLEVKVLRTKERGAWAALFTNLGLSVGMKRDNLGSPKSERDRTVETTRAKDDSLVSFYLRGLKDAVMTIGKTPTARALTE